MGKQLKSIDILGAIEDETPAPKPNAQTPRRKRTPRNQPKAAGDMDIAALKHEAEKAAEGKPSPYQSDLRAKLRQKTQLNFSNIPTFIVAAYAEQAKAAGMNKREYLYHLLRQEGADIPPYEEMDGRKL